MTDPLTVALASVTAGLGATIGWLMWPRPPVLEGERLFKIALATLLRGRIEAAGGDGDAWADAVQRAVPYHPAGRVPERKVIFPAADLPGPSLDGERALCERLASLPDPASRWRWMYDEDEAGPAVLLEDPDAQGAAFDPARALGPGIGWDALAAWGAGASEAFPGALRRLGATWVLLDGRDAGAPRVLDALAGRLPDTVRVPWSGSPDGESLVSALDAALADPARRFVLVAADGGVQSALRALVAHAGLRDRVLAVVAVGGVIGGVPGDDGPLGQAALTDWMGAWFTHHRLDTEVTRRTPYLALQWLDRAADPPGAFGVPVASARFPEARLESLTQESVQSVDLGVLPAESDPELVADALWATVTLWVRAVAS